MKMQYINDTLFNYFTLMITYINDYSELLYEIKSNENIYLESKSIYYNINPRYNFYSFINKNTPDTASIYSFIINYVNIINNRYIIIENINSSYKIYSSNPIYTDYVIKKFCSLINDKI